MKKSLVLLVFLCATFSNAQQLQNFFDFENIEGDSPKGWNNYGSGNYKAAVDTSVSYEGSSSLSIEFVGPASGFHAWGYQIPINFGGEKIKLTGYVKTQNVTNGNAGLWMRVDPNIAMDNMQGSGPKGTTDWQQFEIIVNHDPSQATGLVIGGLMSGKGKMWIDNLEITVDGKSLENAPEKELTPAEMDDEFNAGSDISLRNLTAQQEENLTVLGKVWGFLKYHHPEIASGTYNWDYELLRAMDDIAFAKADTSRDKKILDWINTYPTPTSCTSCKQTTANAVIKPRNEWINDLSDELKTKLNYIYNNRIQGEQYYITMTPNVGNPEFTNERRYTAMTYPDDGFKMIALYRYWNAIQYFFPNTDITDKDWDDVLAEYIPKVLNTRSELAFEKVFIQLIGDVKDTHANLWGGRDKWLREIGEKTPNLHVRFLDNELVIIDFFNADKETSNLKKGDIIKTINGRPIDDIVSEKLPYYPASNPAARLRDISVNILFGNEDSISLTVDRSGETISTSTPLYRMSELDFYRWYKVPEGEPSYKMLEDNIGYITLANIKDEDSSKIIEAFKECTGIVVDIRNYPSAFTPFSLGSFFAPDGSDFVKFTMGNTDNPGEFNFGQPLATGQMVEPKNKFKGKVVVVVNETTQSSAEYTTMAFQAAPQTTVIGSTTSGADGNVSTIPLIGGMHTLISGIGVYYPDGTNAQRTGVKIDQIITPTVQGIQQGRDELLEKAIAIIKEQ